MSDVVNNVVTLVLSSGYEVCRNPRASSRLYPFTGCKIKGTFSLTFSIVRQEFKCVIGCLASDSFVVGN
jgi:hypothetical protein